MGKGNTQSQNILKIFFQAVAWANVADNTATSPLTNIYSSLHTADPTAAGSQTSSEAAYTSYARVAVARTTGGWAITGQTMNPVAAITFPAGTGGSGTATFFGEGTLSSGAGVLGYSGTVTPNITMGSGITPQLSTATAITEA
jgi:hypothetical protein